MTDAPRRFRALFIADVHLGTRGCQADKLLDLLRTHEADTIYLVGDIVDGWALRSSWYWPQAHNDVVQKILRQSRKGARVISSIGEAEIGWGGTCAATRILSGLAPLHIAALACRSWASSTP
jgi:predicted MPP superfamily phosphohydrolase